MIIGVPKEIKDDEYRVAITPAGVQELTERRPRGAHRARARASARRITRRGLRRHRRDDRRRRRRRLGRRPSWCSRSRSPSPTSTPPRRAQGPGALHLPAPGRLAAVHRCARRAPATRRSPTRPCGCANGSLPLLTPMSEVAGTDGAADGRPPPHARRRRARRADLRRARRRRGQRRRPRRRRGRHGGSHAGRRACRPTSTSSTATSSACARSTTTSAARSRPWPRRSTPSPSRSRSPTS